MSRLPFRRRPTPPTFGPSRDLRPARRRSKRSTSPPGPESRSIRRYAVVLHRTETTGLLAVARVLMDLTRFGDAEATHRMWECHHRGRSVVLSTHLERAELYQEQFAEKGLAVSIEPL